MKKMAVKTMCLLGLLTLGACESPEAPPAQEKAKSSKCGLDINTLDGAWVLSAKSQVGGDVDPRSRIKFFEENGTKKAISTLGTIDKLTFTLLEEKPGRRVYIQDVDPKIIEDFKAKNTNPNVGLQAKLYIRVSEPKCKLQVNTATLTYVNGEPKEGQAGARAFYQQYDKPLSWEQCTDPRGLRFSESAIDAKSISKLKGSDKPLLRVIPAQKPSYFYIHYPDSSLKEGCTQSFNLYDEDLQFASGLTDVTAGKGGQVLSFERTFMPFDTARFIEVHRIEKCADGEKVAQVSCGAVKPE